MNNSFKQQSNKPSEKAFEGKIIQEPEKKEENLNLLFKLFEKANFVINTQKTQQNASSRAMFFRSVRVVFAVFIILIGLKLFINKSTQVSSLQGFINTELVAINSPINGTLTLNKSIKVGQYIKANQAIGKVENKYED